MPLTNEEKSAMQRLERLVRQARVLGAAGLDGPGLNELPRLHRLACSVMARLETRSENPALLARVQDLVNRSHGILYRKPGGGARRALSRLWTFFLEECPRTLRAEWRLLALSFGLFYGLALVAWLAVWQDLDLAYSLFDPGAVRGEIAQLESTPAGEPFRGNFDFGIEQSSATASFLMFHNIQVALVLFASALLPPLYLLLIAQNGLMLGTYIGVAGHWGQAGSINSILFCHGTLELQALIFTSTAGLVLVRAVVAPGPWTRRHAMGIESRRALRLGAPAVVMLVFAGLIEGFISPHAGLGVRLAVAGISGLALLAWWAFGGRRRPAERGLAAGSAIVPPWSSPERSAPR